MGAGAIGEQTQLLLLDVVLHLATGTVDLVVELLGIAVEIDDDKTWVAPLCGDFELGDHRTAGQACRSRLTNKARIAQACLAPSILLGRW